MDGDESGWHNIILNLVTLGYVESSAMRRVAQKNMGVLMALFLTVLLGFFMHWLIGVAIAIGVYCLTRTYYQRYLRVTLLTLGVSASCLLAPTLSSAENNGNTIKSALINCNENALSQSRCIIKVILDDISDTYRGVGGGGISSINQDATWSYTVSISQEERIDKITYTVDMSSEGKVTIVERKMGTKSYNIKGSSH